MSRPRFVWWCQWKQKFIGFNNKRCKHEKGKVFCCNLSDDCDTTRYKVVRDERKRK